MTEATRVDDPEITDAWLRYALPAHEYAQAKDLSPSVARELYGIVFKCGPDVFNMHEFDVLLLNVLANIKEGAQAAQFMNKFKATYYSATEQWEGNDFLVAYLTRNPKHTIVEQVMLLGFFDVYSGWGAFYDIYRRAAKLILLHHQGDENEAKRWSQHEKFMRWLRQVQDSSGAPGVRALMRSVVDTGTRSEA